jgi:phospholipid/cholesterol/gamma-HCH transport system ATP-binding protein
MRRFSFGKDDKENEEPDWQALPPWSPGGEAGPEPTAGTGADAPAPSEPEAQWAHTGERWQGTEAEEPAPVAPDTPAESHLTPAGTSYEQPETSVPEATTQNLPPVAHGEPAATAAAGGAITGAAADEPDIDWETPTRDQPQAGHGDGGSESHSRVSVVDEQPPRPAPPAGASEEEYKWHTYRVYPSGRPDAVEFIDTYKAFGKNRILRGLNMGLPEGMVSMILGPSGTGKSVCIKHMVGLLYPDEGDVLVHGQSVPNMADDDLFEMRKKFGLLFQDGALFGSMNLYDNVAFPLRQHTEKGEDEIEDIVMRRLKEVGLGDAREKMPNELSGGMRKRAGFARALVLEPDIVLFDEPDSGLDPVRTALLGELILEIHRDMMEDAKKAQKQHLPTFAVITHDIMSARRVADYINVLWRGRIVEAGPAEDMLNSDNPFIRQFLAGESQGPLTMD